VDVEKEEETKIVDMSQCEKEMKEKQRTNKEK
jgi:hypothetical protein